VRPTRISATGRWGDVQERTCGDGQHDGCAKSESLGRKDNAGRSQKCGQLNYFQPKSARARFHPAALKRALIADLLRDFVRDNRNATAIPA